mmetsp:Transcript_35606/g.94198  ORF Transcript_35606/g.94198 Transcript_35606/m.94198 type:complete len:189 (-) Transcript_35606:66-632(-)
MRARAPRNQPVRVQGQTVACLQDVCLCGCNREPWQQQWKRHQVCRRSRHSGPRLGSGGIRRPLHENGRKISSPRCKAHSTPTCTQSAVSNRSHRTGIPKTACRRCSLVTILVKGAGAPLSETVDGESKPIAGADFAGCMRHELGALRFTVFLPDARQQCISAKLTLPFFVGVHLIASCHTSRMIVSSC